MPYNSIRALKLLRLGTQNLTANFREGQEKGIGCSNLETAGGCAFRA